MSTAWTLPMSSLYTSLMATSTGNPESISVSHEAPRPYHHGNLSEALLAAGIELARQGGREAVVLRAATRMVGVSPRAAYRHFADRDDLLRAVAVRCLAEAAGVIEDHINARLAAAPDASAPETARNRLRGVGEGYIAFAVTEPGWFDAAMSSLTTMELSSHPDAAGESGRTAFQLLEDALRGLVEVGALPPEQAQAAAITCWSAVHGFASLAARGPLRELPTQTRDQIAAQLVEGLTMAVSSGG